MLLLAIPASREALNGDWNQAWLAAMASMPVWLLSPFVYRGLSQWMDRRVLGRCLSASEAERAFAAAIQAAGSEAQLTECAARCLEEIFDPKNGGSTAQARLGMRTLSPILS